MWSGFECDRNWWCHTCVLLL